MDVANRTAAAGIATKWSAAAPYLKSVLRIVAAIMFTQGGTVAFFGWPMPMPDGAPPLEAFSQGWIGSVLMLLGGLMLILGIFTRPVAFLLSGMMAVAYFQFHALNAFWPMLNGGTDAVLYCFIWLYISASGAGPWSIDALRNKNDRHEHDHHHRS